MTISRVRTKGPTFLSRTLRGQYWTNFAYPNGSDWRVSTSLYYPSYDGISVTEQTQCYDELHSGPPYKTGGPLFLLRLKAPDDLIIASGQWKPDNLQKYVGSFCFVVPSTNAYGISAISDHTAASFGATGWNKFRPVKPKASMGQFIAELRDFPSMFKWKVKTFRDLGSNYLNYQFGWLPFLHDLRKWYETACAIEKYISFTRKNNGRWLRRGGKIRDTSTSVPVVNYTSGISPSLTSGYYVNGIPNATVTKTVTDKIWFDSAMKFYIPKLDMDPAKSVWKSELLRKLYGLELTPSLAWELLPFSWLADWFGNIGDIISNISNSSYDNLVAKYAFVMRHRKIELKYSNRISMRGGPTLTLDKTCVAECKERAAASPFGFGVEWPDFSNTQLAILAALGVSRFPR